MPLAEGHKANFQTLLKAVDNDDVCLMACIDKETGETIPVICAMQYSGDEKEPIEFVPIARMFLGNPYEEVEPPK